MFALFEYWRLPAQAAWEAEELRARSLALEERAGRAEGQTEAERARRLEAERALASAHEREAALRVRAVALETHSSARHCLPNSLAPLAACATVG